MSAPVIAFFNNKGGVGKTSLVYHLSWMFAELGFRTLAADLDPQANLTAAFLEEEALEDLWRDGGHNRTIYGCIDPLVRGVGDVADPVTLSVEEGLSLVPGDLALSRFEDELATGWPGALDRQGACVSGTLGILAHSSEGRQPAASPSDIGRPRSQPGLDKPRGADLGRFRSGSPLAGLVFIAGVTEPGPGLRRMEETME
jgi:chromosome partitioning protein